MNRRACLLLLIGLLPGCQSSQDDPSGTGLRGLDGRSVPLASLSGPKGILMVFVAVDCPIANRFLPELEAIGTRATGGGLAFAYVYASPFETDVQVAAHRKEYGLRQPAFRDGGMRMARKLGACITPEAVLMRADGSIAYRGRVNDQYSAPGQGRPSPTRRDLAEAVEAHIGGGWEGLRGLPAVGCRFRDP